MMAARKGAMIGLCEAALRRGKGAMLLSLTLFLAGGCAIRHQVSFSDRCADVMREAFPSAAIKITKGEASAASITGVTARVTGLRTDLPEHSTLARNLTALCRFHNGILTEFRWTKGPLH
jgi:hypothetical protein